jgi:hypothetical protein
MRAYADGRCGDKTLNYIEGVPPRVIPAGSYKIRGVLRKY